MTLKCRLLAVLFAMLFLAASLAGCSGKGNRSIETVYTDGTSSANSGETIAVNSIYLNDKLITLSVGDTYIIATSIYPTNATDKTVIWTSSKKTAVSVENGKITANAPGTAKITAKASNGATAECTVKVVKKTIVPSYIRLDKTLLTLNVGDTVKLTAAILPSSAGDKTVTWKSDNSMIAFVEDGKVTAVSAGNTRISAVTSNNLVATCTVRVDDPEIEPSVIGLSTTSINLQAGKSFRLIASVLPTNASDKSVTWETDNGTVATVADGMVTAHSRGVATIKAITSNGLTIDCVVTVT